MLSLIHNGDYLELCGSNNEITKITSNARFKTRIKRYVDLIFDGSIKFRSEMYYKEIEGMIENLRYSAEKKNIEMSIDSSVYNFIIEAESYIESKYSIGNDIKNRDERYAEKFEYFKNIVNQEMSRPLREKQMWDAFFMTFIQKAGNFSVPGSGKTSSVLGMFAYLSYLNQVKKIVMIGPKNSFKSWKDEFDVCFKDRKQRITLDIQNVINKKFALEYESGAVNLILINYEAVESIQEELKNLIKEDTLLVFDEIHRIKNPEGKWAAASKYVSQNARFIVALTGTPIPNGYQDIYNLLNILYPQDYHKFFKFSLQMLNNPQQQDIIKINEKLQPFFCRTNKTELSVPLQNEDIIFDVHQTEIENKLFRIIYNKHRKNPLEAMIRILQLESDPRMLLKKLNLENYAKVLDYSNKITDEIDYKDYSDEIEPLIEKIGTSSKMKSVINHTKNLVTESKTVIIWCIFVDSMINIQKMLINEGIKAEIISGQVDSLERERIIETFKNQNIDVLITNPHTLAESVSLHQNCHDAIYFEYSYNLVHLLQSKDRIHRLGLKKTDYTQYYFMQCIYNLDFGEYSLDKVIYERLKMKENLMLEAIDNNTLEVLPTDDEELEFLFKKLMLFY
ncbi:DEAD/DEAH box helicase [Macrococcus bovicus]|uniref:DEAD/DEAH box helicase n=1 Tax=Macrococcus bovicus TaxID=69968 RepID=UPI0025A5C516|nr:DEAD/DEAH box helicase [Macrococcus bovicus]WJP97396.1 DEAD/DEAH box helicase [Macrococcus bovicus]